MKSRKKPQLSLRNVGIMLLLFSSCLASVSHAQLNEAVIEPQGGSEQATPDGNVYTLEEALEQVTERAPTVAIAQSEVEAAVLRRLAVRMERVPEFRVRAGLGPGPRDVDPTEGEELRYFQGVTIAGVAGMRLPITTFGKIQTGTELAEAGIELERVEEKSAKLEARYEAFRAYLAAQWARDARELLDDAQTRVDEAEESLLDKMDEGDYTVRNDLRQIDMLRADLLSMRNEVERSGFLARTGLRIVLDVGEDTPLEPFDQTVEELTPPSFEEVFRVAKTNRPELERVEIGVRARELELQLEKKRALPDVFFAAVGEVTWTPTLEGRPTISEEANNFNELSGILALGIRWELNPGVHRARVRRLEQRAETMRITQDAAEDSARLDIREAYLRAVHAHEFVAAAKRAKRSAEAWLNQTGFQFEQGLADFEEFEDPLKAYYERTAAYLRAVLTYRLRVANLAVKCGVDDLRNWPGMSE